MAYANLSTWVAHVTAITAARLNQLNDNFVALTQWQSYTPVVTQVGTVTKTTTYAKYIYAGNLVICQVKLVVTGSGTGANAFTITLPKTASTTGQDVGPAAFYDSSSTTTYPGIAQILTTNTIALYRSDTSFTAFMGGDPNPGLAVNDQIRFAIAYEAA